VFQMPADVSVIEDEHLVQQFTTYFQTPQLDALSRMKLFKLAWDMVGSEFAGRHLQYEKFYAEASFIVRGHAYRSHERVARGDSRLPQTVGRGAGGLHSRWPYPASEVFAISV